jgi:hypothetical protein
MVRVVMCKAKPKTKQELHAYHNSSGMPTEHQERITQEGAPACPFKEKHAGSPSIRQVCLSPILA